MSSLTIRLNKLCVLPRVACLVLCKFSFITWDVLPVFLTSLVMRSWDFWHKKTEHTTHFSWKRLGAFDTLVEEGEILPVSCCNLVGPFYCCNSARMRGKRCPYFCKILGTIQVWRKEGEMLPIACRNFAQKRSWYLIASSLPLQKLWGKLIRALCGVPDRAWKQETSPEQIFSISITYLGRPTLVFL